MHDRYNNHERGESHFRREIMGRWDPDIKGTSKYDRDYKNFWYDVNGMPIAWHEIKDGHLSNIIRMVGLKNWSTTMAEPWQKKAYNYAHMEKNRRAEGMKSPGTHINCRNSTDDHFIDALKYVINLPEGIQVDKEKLMYNACEDKSYPMPDRPAITLEELPKYFGRKVKLYNGQRGIVVGIYHPEYSSEGMARPHAQLRVKLEKGSSLMNANEVELVEVLTLFAYQSKDGTVEWTSKMFIDSTLKRKGMKRLPTATKYIDIN